MKQLLTILTLATVFSAYSQEKNLRWGINLNTDAALSYNYYFQFRNPVSLFATITKGKHQFEFGPQVYLDKYRPGYKLGLATDYKYYPNGFSNRFNTYFTASLLYQKGKEERGSWTHDMDTHTDVFGGEIITINQGLIGVGYGVELKVSDRFYLGSDFQMLFGYSKIKIVKSYLENPALNETNRYNRLSIYPQFGLNFGYRF